MLEKVRIKGTDYHGYAATILDDKFHESIVEVRVDNYPPSLECLKGRILVPKSAVIYGV